MYGKFDYSFKLSGTFKTVVAFVPFFLKKKIFMTILKRLFYKFNNSSETAKVWRREKIMKMKTGSLVIGHEFG